MVCGVLHIVVVPSTITVPRTLDVVYRAAHHDGVSRGRGNVVFRFLHLLDDEPHGFITAITYFTVFETSM